MARFPRQPPGAHPTDATHRPRRRRAIWLALILRHTRAEHSPRKKTPGAARARRLSRVSLESWIESRVCLSRFVRERETRARERARLRTKRSSARARPERKKARGPREPVVSLVSLERVDRVSCVCLSLRQRKRDARSRAGATARKALVRSSPPRKKKGRGLCEPVSGTAARRAHMLRRRDTPARDAATRRGAARSPRHVATGPPRRGGDAAVTRRDRPRRGRAGETAVRETPTTRRGAEALRCLCDTR